MHSAFRPDLSDDFPYTILTEMKLRSNLRRSPSELKQRINSTFGSSLSTPLLAAPFQTFLDFRFHQLFQCITPHRVLLLDEFENGRILTYNNLSQGIHVPGI